MNYDIILCIRLNNIKNIPKTINWRSENFYLKDSNNKNVIIKEIDWGDGTVDTSYSHTYQKSGEYTIRIAADNITYISARGSRPVLTSWYTGEESPVFRVEKLPSTAEKLDFYQCLLDPEEITNVLKLVDNFGTTGKLDKRGEFTHGLGLSAQFNRYTYAENYVDRRETEANNKIQIITKEGVNAANNLHARGWWVDYSYEPEFSAKRPQDPANLWRKDGSNNRHLYCKAVPWAEFQIFTHDNKTDITVKTGESFQLKLFIKLYDVNPIYYDSSYEMRPRIQICKQRSDGNFYYSDWTLYHDYGGYKFLDSDPKYGSITDPKTFYLTEPGIYKVRTMIEGIEWGTTHSNDYPNNNFVIITVEKGGETIDTNENTQFQSSSLYGQASGSQGTDSAKGIHLRWLLKDKLENHLPKGLVERKGDYVSLYRTPYVPKTTSLDLTLPPTAVNSGQNFWIYEIGDKKLYVNFLNKEKYNQVSSLFNPFNKPKNFIDEYGKNLISIETKTHVSFAVQVLPSSTSGTVKLEVLSVEKNTLNAPKFVSFRGKRSGNEISKKIVEENIREIRFISQDTPIYQIVFEFYDDFFQITNQNSNWMLISNEFSLTTDDTVAFQRLEPVAGSVHGKWLRYNDNAYVNIDNYKEKWKSENEFEGLKYGVEKYLQLSGKDPLANETITQEGSDTDEEGNPLDNSTEVSFLALLQLASLDYHNARMLGLGHLDLSPDAQSGQQYIYLVTYNTVKVNPNDTQEITRHIYQTLPTSIYEERLPQNVSLKNPVPGFISQMEDEDDETENFLKNLKDGYTPDGKTRYVSLFVKEEKEEPVNPPFYYSDQEVDCSTFTFPVHIGLEYKKDDEQSWRKPELLNNSDFQNIDSTVTTVQEKNETVLLSVPDENEVLHVHAQKQTGKHWYASYGINWFSRASQTSDPVFTDTNIQPENPLLPPYNITSLLIKKEEPLLFTSEEEQEKYSRISNKDKTLIRLTCDYDFYQDHIEYQKAVDGEVSENFSPLDIDQEIFGEKIELFFRPEIPGQIIGKIKSVSPDTNPLISIVETEKLSYASTGEEFIPYLTSETKDNYIGSIFIADNTEYIIHQIIPSAHPEQGATFYLLNKQLADAFGNPASVPPDQSEFTFPKTGTSFLIIENMQNTGSWGTNSLHPLKIQIGNNWKIHEEEVLIPNESGTDTFLRRFRGIYENATVEKVPNEKGIEDGLYKISFNEYILAQHPQYNSQGLDSVEWYKGYIRIPYQSDPDGERKKLKVIKTENIGTSQQLVVYAFDESFSEDEKYKKLQTSDSRNNIKVNYYPGYKIYLYKKETNLLTEEYIFPSDDSNEKYSIFGLRTLKKVPEMHSRISTPVLMFAHKDKEPMVPDTPKGAKYTTRPDYYGKASYTFTTRFKQEPYGMIFYRANIENLLFGLYQYETLETITELNTDGFSVNRWEDLVSLSQITAEGLLPEYNGYRLPLPDNPDFYNAVNTFIEEHNQFMKKHYGQTNPVALLDPSIPHPFNETIIPENTPVGIVSLTIADFAKRTMENCFVPLTEYPIVYKHVKGNEYKPLPKEQKIRDKNGYLMNPLNPEFDIAPMMKITGKNETSFTDFTIDGAANTLYFYGVREINLQLQQSAMSPILGPIHTVNAYAPAAPQIKRILPVLAEPIVGIQPAIQLEINAYPEDQKIQKIHLYRSTNSLDATSVRTMKLVDTFTVNQVQSEDKTIWIIKDFFQDMDDIPYMEPIFYRITVSSEIEYADLATGNNIPDYTPSQPSDWVMGNITDNVQPESPKLSYTSELIDENGIVKDINLYWEKTVHNGSYHLYQLTPKGNWELIHQLSSDNSSILTLPLEKIEKFKGLNNLVCKNSEGKPVYHHFKVIAENSSGIYSSEEKILTIYLNKPEEGEGIGYMIIEDNFIVYGDENGIGHLTIEKDFIVHSNSTNNNL